VTEEISLRIATAKDLEFLYSLLKAALGPYVEQTYGPWHEEEQRDRFFEFTKPEAHQIVESDGQPIGCLNIEWLPDEVKLKRVFLLPAFQKRGIGSRLVRQVLSEAKLAGLPVRLRVFKVNPAQRLWQRLGFRVSGETDSHILMEHAAQQGAPADEPQRGPIGLWCYWFRSSCCATRSEIM
jgi:GNAT superfamily N-acetyltransferase